MFKLDRNSFAKQSFKDAADYARHHKNMTVNERLALAYYLNAAAYNFDINHPPRMDKTFFLRIKRK
ncbi:MAG: hypothetical protein IPM95_12195 [Sphingobacteriales bacterium]|nr:hypothetical protein [Sphingobacteriales bacterium]